MSAPSTPRQVPLADLAGRPCPAAAALELVGERWSLLVVRELLLGARRFTDVLRGTGAPRDRVTARLRSLEGAGLVVRRRYQESPPREEYLLTEAGLALAPVVDALIAWGRTYAVAPDDPLRDRYRRIGLSGPDAGG
ncbi:winged helix-turn-helix transcriptional regulator [Nocardioides sp. AX2bis]|uniref:winged helix-turn-helix transcriptional regulator n=1 Tax=Nocardioides sp. AX2bis TaxID=2653157 RepID=UPI0012F1DE70|nr:helix-turn-helix domain-containing protein [Nocardioides sp. AX2bis]VXB47507.1 HxlR family transcriptional regulator [Nocardioides sp. AX2bis]